MTNPAATMTECNRFESWLAELAQAGRTERTLQEYKGDWLVFSQWFRGINEELFEIAALTGRDLRDYVDHELRAKRAVNTVNRRLGTMKRYAAYAVDNGWLGPDVYRNLRRVPAIRSQQVAPEGVEGASVRKLLRKVERVGDRRDVALLSLLAHTGLRVGELVELKMADLAFSEGRGTIIVHAAYAKGSKERRVPIPAEVRELIHEYLATREGLGDDAALFVGERGPLTASGVHWLVGKYAAMVGLKLSPHQLRHAFAYAFLRSSNNNLVALADVLGHESLTTTRRYTRTRPQDLAEEIEKVQFA
ncbi:MAG: tyrosine-type recombinase/integrase [Candidatus Schekmanbacteria bacterium]|nr:tyrosine-type recombinase/integrase [Candidatus Schekmanbacteria bacterium]